MIVDSDMAYEFPMRLSDGVSERRLLFGTVTIDPSERTAMRFHTAWTEIEVNAESTSTFAVGIYRVDRSVWYG